MAMAPKPRTTIAMIATSTLFAKLSRARNDMSAVFFHIGMFVRVMLTVRLAQMFSRGYNVCVESEREALLRRVAEADQRMRGLLPYDRIFSVNLTMQQLKVLILISRSDHMTAQELTRHLGVTLATTSGIVDRLVAHDYVSRHEDPHDRRVRRIRMAPAGKTALDDIMDSGREAQRRLLARLDDDTLRMLEVVLERLGDAARAEAAELPSDF
jgi:DNA-binding MarR family transcriptional regulator